MAMIDKDESISEVEMEPLSTASLSSSSSSSPDDHFPSNIVHNKTPSEPQKTSNKRIYTPPKWFHIAYYLTLSSLAVAFSILSKTTRLWIIEEEPSSNTTENINTISDTRGRVDNQVLYHLLFSFVTVLVSYFAVQGSDPGFLTKEVMEWVSTQDGLTLMGLPVVQDSEHDEETVTDSTLTAGSSNMASSTTEMTRRTMQRHLKENQHDQPQANFLSQNESSTLNKDEFTSSVPSPSKPRTRRKPCHQVGFAPLLRSHYCRKSQKCVATFDHYCGFLGTCIGERNHCRFYWFLTFQTIGFITCVSIVNTSHLGLSMLIDDRYVDERYDNVTVLDIVTVILAKFYLYPLTFASVTMWLIHSWLALTNTTSFELGYRRHIEYMEGMRECDFPFSGGLFSNLHTFCCFRDDASICRRWTKQQIYDQDGVPCPPWKPIIWKAPGKINRDSDNCWENPWQNKYYSCC